MHRVGAENNLFKCGWQWIEMDAEALVCDWAVKGVEDGSTLRNDGIIGVVGDGITNVQ